MKKIFLFLAASMLVLCSCNKDDEPKPSGEENQLVGQPNEQENDQLLDEYAVQKISEIQQQIIGTDWFLECKNGFDDYNNSEFKYSSYYNFTEDEVYETYVVDGSTIKRCAYSVLGDTVVAYNDFILCEAGKACLFLQNDTLYWGNYSSKFRTDPLSSYELYFVKK